MFRNLSDTLIAAYTTVGKRVVIMPYCSCISYDNKYGLVTQMRQDMNNAFNTFRCKKVHMEDALLNNLDPISGRYWHNSPIGYWTDETISHLILIPRSDVLMIYSLLLL